MTTPTCVLLSDRPDLVGPAASLLAAQWPASSATSRRSALQAHIRKAKKDEIPCHLLLLDADDMVTAHGRLQPACENADGFSAAITSVVVDPSRRGAGLGRELRLESHGPVKHRPAYRVGSAHLPSATRHPRGREVR